MASHLENIQLQRVTLGKYLFDFLDKDAFETEKSFV